ncbi:putative vacuolar protein sorting 33a-like protein [Erysiphe necator]|uniref:Putative vacuolar protein sorting 33a-like protein n=1 Tax=Uncinula necator TaxID=52586 RepID=A0A0B1PE98_UNCNE|nr:putative vacuolar protein sorting 33a-like protein [Erysiphe necator]
MDYSSPYPILQAAHLSKQHPNMMGYERSPMISIFGSQISRRDNLNLMGLQEFDSHLSMFENSNIVRNFSTPDRSSNSTLEEIFENQEQKNGSISQSHLSTAQYVPYSENANRGAGQIRQRCHSKPLSDDASQVWPELNGNSVTPSSNLGLDEESSILSSVSSKTTSPTDFETSSRVKKESTPPRENRREKYKIRPKSSIPIDIAPSEYARQCIAAAESSRLNPYSLHKEEYEILRGHITHQQVTTYLNIRNGILRLWIRNPTIYVELSEAIGCAKDSRWFDVASLCHEWLIRGGFINFGCLEQAYNGPKSKNYSLKRKRRVVVVIGAGMSGLGCARQLEGLFLQFEDRFHELGEDLPQVVIVEGRNRIGGRIYSRALITKPKYPTLDFGSRYTAEMGGMIITGFDRGNPLNVIVRSQLALQYYALKPDTPIYDSCGETVDFNRDQLAEKLFNYILDRVSEYKFKIPISKTIDGDKALLDAGREPNSEGSKTILDFENSEKEPSYGRSKGSLSQAQMDSDISNSMSKELRQESDPGVAHTAAYKAKEIGWNLKLGVSIDHDLDLEGAVSSKDATLGSVIDEAIRQYTRIVDFTPLDLRLINWHVANLEYSNAITCNKLSLGGWDLDAGNEWEGKHTMVTGGYQQVPRGLFRCPQPLTIRKNSTVKRIIYNDRLHGSNNPKARIECQDGIIEADCIVSTIPLGVLKQQSIQFEPALPEWKKGAIQRIGYGVLNKIILVYSEVFWDPNRDIFGTLRSPQNRNSLDQKDYFSQRGRFFQWFNVSSTSGLPTLLALMAGEAAFATEKSTDEELLNEATTVLQTLFGPNLPTPIEAVVTRWGHDEYSRGSYSYTGPNFRPNDYEVMAQPIGNLFFAGEHTCGTHPATVHGAYISGLRAASEVLDFMIGGIQVPMPLILPRDSTNKRKTSSIKDNMDAKKTRLESYEVEICNAIHKKLGDRPWRPPSNFINPYRLYSKDKWEEAKRLCEEGRRPGRGKINANEVKKMVAKLWKDTSEEDKLPYIKKAEAQKMATAAAMIEYNTKVEKWDKDALAFREEYKKENPNLPSPNEIKNTLTWDRRAKRVVTGYAEDSDSEIESF